MILEYELTAEDVRQAVLNTLKEHLSLETEGHRCTTDMMWNVLLQAAVDSAAAWTTRVPSWSKLPPAIGCVSS